MATGSAVIIGALKGERSENTVEELCTTAHFTCALAAIAGLVRLAAVGVIRVQTLFDSTSREAEHLLAYR